MQSISHTKASKNYMTNYWLCTEKKLKKEQTGVHHLRVIHSIHSLERIESKSISQNNYILTKKADYLTISIFSRI